METMHVNDGKEQCTWLRCGLHHSDSVLDALLQKGFRLISVNNKLSAGPVTLTLKVDKHNCATTHTLTLCPTGIWQHFTESTAQGTTDNLPLLEML